MLRERPFCARESLLDLVVVESGKFFQLFARGRVDRRDCHCVLYINSRIDEIGRDGSPSLPLRRARRPRPTSCCYNRRPLGIKTRSSKSKSDCTSSASTAAGIAPCKIVTRSFRLSPLKIGSPSPPAPISAASVAVPTLITALVL